MTEEEALTLLIDNGAVKNLYLNWAYSGAPFVVTEVNLENAEGLKAALNGDIHPYGDYNDTRRRPLNDYRWTVNWDRAISVLEMLVAREDFKQRCPYKYGLALEIIARAKAKKMAS